MHVSSYGQMYRFGCPYVYSKQRGSDNPDQNLDRKVSRVTSAGATSLTHYLTNNLSLAVIGYKGCRIR